MRSPSFSRPTGRPSLDQANTKKAGEPAGPGLAWTVSRRPDQVEARTGPAGLLRPLGLLMRTLPQEGQSSCMGLGLCIPLSLGIFLCIGGWP